MKIVLFLGLWLILKNFLAAVIIFCLLWFIHFLVKSFWGLTQELGFFNAVFILIGFSWLFGRDD
ncbi:MAG: hypothetical protein K9L22_10780 [Methylococcaceae bacterium]|nr:hypothetical protein [Methylococcaceae bacterium]